MYANEVAKEDNFYFLKTVDICVPFKSEHITLFINYFPHKSLGYHLPIASEQHKLTNLIYA